MKNIIKWGLIGFLGLVVLGTIFGDDQETERQAEVNEPEQSESDELKSLTEKQRRQIFREIIAAERRAMAEADELYSGLTDTNQRKENFEEMVDKNIDKSRELMEKYKTQIRTKYGITEDTELKIGIEGNRKRRQWLPEDYQEDPRPEAWRDLHLD